MLGVVRAPEAPLLSHPQSGTLATPAVGVVWLAKLPVRVGKLAKTVCLTPPTVQASTPLY